MPDAAVPIANRSPNAEAIISSSSSNVTGGLRSSFAREEHRTGDGAAPIRNGRDLDLLAGHLPITRATPQLESGLVDEPEAVEAARGQLATVGVEGEVAVEGDPRPPLD